MESKKVDAPPDESENSYKIISYRGQDLPSEYLNVIRSPFLKTLRYGNELFKLIDQESYFAAYGKYIDLLLKRDGSRVRLAVLRDGTVLGWSLSQPDILHYVWVKKEVRLQGIGNALMPEMFSTFTHITNKCLSIWGKKKYQHLRFNPFL